MSPSVSVARQAVGALRDLLSGINNLVQLLRSRNVAPKAIAQVLGELPGAQDAVLPLFDALAAEPLPLRGVPLASAPLRSLLVEQLEAFSAAVEKARARTMNAAARLTLEHALVPVAQQLAGALALLELWADLYGEWRPLDVVELLTLSRSGDQPQTPGTVSREVQLATRAATLELDAPPRALLNWIGLAASLADPKRQAPGFVFTLAAPASDRAVELSIRASSSPTPGFALLLPPRVSATEALVVEAGNHLGLNIRTEDGGVSIQKRAAS